MGRRETPARRRSESKKLGQTATVAFRTHDPQLEGTIYTRSVCTSERFEAVGAMKDGTSKAKFLEVMHGKGCGGSSRESYAPCAQNDDQQSSPGSIDTGLGHPSCGSPRCPVSPNAPRRIAHVEGRETAAAKGKLILQALKSHHKRPRSGQTHSFGHTITAQFGEPACCTHSFAPVVLPLFLLMCLDAASRGMSTVINPPHTPWTQNANIKSKPRLLY